MMILQIEQHKHTLVTGHYGSGKTNFSLNLAMDHRRRGEPVTLADLDIVNPYFRTSDFQGFAQENGIRLVASEYAGSTLEIPALTGQLDACIGGEDTLIVDVGGDDVGSYALGRFAPRLNNLGYTMLYVVNYYRPLVREPKDCVEVLREIEAASRLKATHIVNCSNLGRETTAEEVRASLPYAERVAELAGMPIAMTVARREIADELSDVRQLFAADIYVTVPWN